MKNNKKTIISFTVAFLAPLFCCSLYYIIFVKPQYDYQFEVLDTFEIINKEFFNTWDHFFVQPKSLDEIIEKRDEIKRKMYEISHPPVGQEEIHTEIKWLYYIYIQSYQIIIQPPNTIEQLLNKLNNLNEKFSDRRDRLFGLMLENNP